MSRLQTKKSRSLSRLGIFLVGMSVVSFIVFYLVTMISNQGYRYIDVDTLEFVQNQEIPEHSQIAVIDTSLGEIRAVLYPAYAPQTVAQFVRLAQEGYYDNTYIFEAKNDVYFAAGSIDPLGSLPENTPEAQERLPQEIHQNLWTFRGALCAINTASDTSFTKRLFKTETYYTGSRFMILNSVDFSDPEFLEEFREASGSEELADLFIEKGGVPNFAQQMTVFGQVYQGLDVVEMICAAQLQEENPQGYTPPEEDILIRSIRISEYIPEEN
ncbi:MAG: peptidylprolyl isomerase [Oscillospiraceae bacterium]|nr:peptidylprolyl isomerase [Oscillospiraceae bacterium]